MTIIGERNADLDPILFISIRPPSVTQGGPEHIRINQEFKKRFKSFSFTNHLEKASEVSITVDNVDLYWIDENDVGPTSISIGTQVDFQYGYINQLDRNLDLLSPIRTYTISAIPPANPQTLTFKATGQAQNILGGTVSPQWAAKQKASDVVRRIAADAGFDASHRRIQDTKYEVETMAIHSGQSLMNYIYELAKGYNYRFYITTASDGKSVFHFHKPGWQPEDTVDQAPRQLSPEEISGVNLIGRNLLNFGIGTFIGNPGNLNSAVNSAVNGEAFGVEGNGNTVRAKGVIRFRPSSPNESRVIDWNAKENPDGTPATLKGVGLDTKEGKPISVQVGESDKHEASLSRRTIHANSELTELPIDPILGPRKSDQGKLSSKLAGNTNLPGFGNALEQAKKKNVELFVGFERRPNVSARQQVLLADSRDRSEDHTKAALEQSQSRLVEMSLTLFGDPSMDAGDIWKLEGFRKYSSFYLFQSVEHTFDAGAGYTTQVSCTTDGVNSKESQPTSRFNEKKLDLNVEFIKTEGGPRRQQLNLSDGSVIVKKEGE